MCVCIFKCNKPYPSAILQSQHNKEVREEGDCKSVSFAISVSLVSTEVATVTKTGVRIFSLQFVRLLQDYLLLDSNILRKRTRDLQITEHFASLKVLLK